MMTVKKTTAPELNSDEIYVGQRLRERRLAMRMSQTELGAVANISFQQIQKYERGINRIAFSTLQKFADALQTPIQYFLKDSNSQGGLASNVRQAPFAVAPARDTQELLRVFSEIEDPAIRKQVVQLAKTLAESQGRKKKNK